MASALSGGPVVTGPARTAEACGDGDPAAGTCESTHKANEFLRKRYRALGPDCPLCKAKGTFFENEYQRTQWVCTSEGHRPEHGGVEVAELGCFCGDLVDLLADECAKTREDAIADVLVERDDAHIAEFMKTPMSNPSEAARDAVFDEGLLKAIARRLLRSPAERQRLEVEFEEETTMPERDVRRLLDAAKAVGAAFAATVLPSAVVTPPASSVLAPALLAAPAASGGSAPAPPSIASTSPAPSTRIVVTSRYLHELTEEASDALVKVNQVPVLFRAAGGSQFAGLSADGKGRIELHTVATLSVLSSRSAEWVKRVAAGKPGAPDRFIPVLPEPRVIRALLDAPPAALPVLNAVKWTPYLGSAGALVTSPGYHAPDEVFLIQDQALRLLQVPVAPTELEVMASRDMLLNDLFVDFPFVTQADRANMLAFFFSPFVMTFIVAHGGTAPLVLLEAAVFGTGKTLLGHLTSAVNTGRPMSWRAFPRDEAERQKTILTAAMEGAPFIAFDNAKGEVGGEALEGALTTPLLSGRLLGTNKDVRVTNAAVWVLTGNNATLTPDMVRRSVRVRIDAGVEDPTKGRSFKHDDIMGWAMANRPALVHAVLTLVQNWVAKGRPPFSGKPRASFEAWSRTLGGILECAGVEGFLGEEATLEAANSERGEATAFVEAWYEEFGAEEVTTKQMLEAFVAPPVETAYGDKKAPVDVEYLESVLVGAPSTRGPKLGRWLKANVDRVFADLIIKRGTDDAHAKVGRYRLEVKAGDGGGPRTTAQTATPSNRAPSDGDFGFAPAAEVVAADTRGTGGGLTS